MGTRLWKEIEERVPNVRVLRTSHGAPTRVELCFQAPNGERGGYDVLLEEGRRMPVPDCGEDPAAAAKSQAELKVAGVRLWT